jgi:hypothetical protein
MTCEELRQEIGIELSENWQRFDPPLSEFIRFDPRAGFVFTTYAFIEKFKSIARG